MKPWVWDPSLQLLHSHTKFTIRCQVRWHTLATSALGKLRQEDWKLEDCPGILSITQQNKKWKQSKTDFKTKQFSQKTFSDDDYWIWSKAWFAQEEDGTGWDMHRVSTRKAQLGLLQEVWYHYRRFPKELSQVRSCSWLSFMESCLMVGTMTIGFHFDRLSFVLSISESFNKQPICAILRMLSITRLVEGGAELHRGDWWLS